MERQPDRRALDTSVATVERTRRNSSRKVEAVLTRKNKPNSVRHAFSIGAVKRSHCIGLRAGSGRARRTLSLRRRRSWYFVSSSVLVRTRSVYFEKTSSPSAARVIGPRPARPSSRTWRMCWKSTRGRMIRCVVVLMRCSSKSIKEYVMLIVVRPGMCVTTTNMSATAQPIVDDVRTAARL